MAAPPGPTRSCRRRCCGARTRDSTGHGNGTGATRCWRRAVRTTPATRSHRSWTSSRFAAPIPSTTTTASRPGRSHRTEQSPMATARRRLALLVVFGAMVFGGERPAAQSPTFGVGRAPKPEEVQAIDIDVTPDGRGLLPGASTAAAGKDVYTRRCETCHGPTGKEGPQDVLVGGQGSLA